jgi:hypothetical protein
VIFPLPFLSPLTFSWKKSLSGSVFQEVFKRNIIHGTQISWVRLGRGTCNQNMSSLHHTLDKWNNAFLKRHLRFIKRRNVNTSIHTLFHSVSCVIPFLNTFVFFFYFR